MLQTGTFNEFTFSAALYYNTMSVHFYWSDQHSKVCLRTSHKNNYLKSLKKCLWCLSPFGLLSQPNIDWVAYKQQKFIPHSSGVWEAQDHGTGRFCICIFVTHRQCLVTGLTWWKEWKLSWASFIRALISFMRALPTHYLKTPPPNTVTLGIMFSAYEFGGDTSIQYIASGNKRKKTDPTIPKI